MSLAGKHIWICPLNWGLGHASRCIPIIRALRSEGATVYLASDGDAAELLRKEFPELPLFELPGYRVQYGRRSAIGGLLWRLPAIFKAIKAEQKVLATLLEQHPCDLIISDNRYGAWSAKHPSVILTHQLHLAIPNSAQPFSKQLLKYWFSNFTEIWVPDWSDEAALAGKLSKEQFAIPTRHLGILSRMQLSESKKELDILAVLSGPEPQRSQLEKMILDQLRDWTGRVAIVRGTKVKLSTPAVPDHVQLIDLADTAQLEQLMGQAKMIVCRTGYSSLMDLVQMEKPALLIPTPGQPEQEYLAEFHQQRNWWTVQSQSALNLLQAWQQRDQLAPPQRRKMIIANWIEACRELIIY